MSPQWISICVLMVFTVTITGSCPKGWQTFRGNCYFLNTARKLWIDAMMDCMLLGAHLARVESAEETMFLKNTYSSKSKFIWLDGTDIHKEGQWIWSSTYEPFVYKNWAKGQPDNRSSKQHYLILYSSGKWDDGDVNYTTMSICEIDANGNKDKGVCPCSKFLLEELVKCKKKP